MSTQKTKSSVGAFGILLFIAGLILMIVAEHVDMVFAIGFLLFLTSILMAIVTTIWRIAGDADRFLGRYLDGGSE